MRAYDGDKGPNTGGMGAYSPVPQIGQDVVDTAIETIVKPTVQAMSDEGTPFTGILYAGLIATADGPKVIEFNARFGDPETEVVLPKLTSDLGAGISALLNGETPEFTWDNDNATLGVVLAADGYPVDVIKGAAIPEIPVDEDSHVYYAGVARSEEGLSPIPAACCWWKPPRRHQGRSRQGDMRLSTSSTPRACSTVTTSRQGTEHLNAPSDCIPSEMSVTMQSQSYI